jgi:low temperature requirement protein LtrA
MKRLTSDAVLFRSRGNSESGKVSFIELFFDLIFVFAVTQLSHSFLKNFTWEGALQLGILTMAIWWVWIFTAWVMNWLNPETSRVRFMLIGLMLVGLIMSASLPEAFEKSGIYFACAYTLFQVGRTAYTVWVLQKGSTELRINFIRILSWLTLSGIFWIAGGIAHEETRLTLWCIALFIEYLSPSLGFWVPKIGKTPTTVWDVEGSHMAERCGLFIIIALGESILVTGATFAEHEWDILALSSFATAFLSTVTMWWIYFNMTAKTGHHFIAHSNDPGRVARSAYTYTHLLLVGGIILSAVADELVLAHPSGHLEMKTAVVILAGPALYLLGNMLFMRIAAGVISAPYTAGIIMLVVLFPFYSILSPLLLSFFATVTLIAVSIWGSVFTERLCQATPLQGHHKTESH